MSGFYERGEERFGRLSTWIYSRFAQRFIRDLHAFAFEEVVKYARVEEVETILDVGCGPGLVARLVAKRLPEAEVVGIDPSRFMVEEAKRETLELGVRNVRFELGSSRRPPNESYGLIYSVLSFHHWVSQEESLNMLYTHLVGKRLLLFEYNRYASPFLFRGHSVTYEYFKGFSGKTLFNDIQVFGKKRVIEASFLK
jgi:SAM-dependent methyltransferase